MSDQSCLKASDEGPQVSIVFIRIKDAEVPRHVLRLVRQIVDGDGDFVARTAGSVLGAA